MINKYKKLINNKNDDSRILCIQLYKEWSLWLKFFGNILVITGPTSSGKTTILLKILQHFPNCKTINRKMISKQVELTLDKKFFTEVFKKATNIIGNEIKDSKTFWEINLEELPNKNALEFKVIQEEFNEIVNNVKFAIDFLTTTFSLYYEESKKYIFSGYNMILDESLLYGEMSYSIFNYYYNYYPKIKFLLLFNTLEETLEKCKIRNDKFIKFIHDYCHNSRDIWYKLEELEQSTGNSSSSYRMPTQMMNMYMNFYHFKSVLSIGELPLEKISKQKFQSIINKTNREELIFFKKLKKLKINLPIKFEIIDSIEKTEMTFSENNYCYVVSKNPYDFFVRASKIKNIKSLDDLSFFTNFLSKVLEWLGYTTIKYKHTKNARVSRNYDLIKPSLLFQFPKLIGWHSSSKSMIIKNRCVVQNKKPFEWSFVELFNEMRFYRYFTGRIIFLLGTSSAGKSSIISYVKKNSITDSNLLRFTGTDAIFYNVFVDFFYKKFPRDVKFLFDQIRDVSKIFEYINEPEKFTLDNLECLYLNFYINMKTILETFRDIKKKFLSDIIKEYNYYCAKAIIFPLLQGKTIVVDTIELQIYLQILCHHFIQCRKDIIVVYCSPEKLEERILQRNKLNIRTISINNIRFFFPFEQYNDIYTSTVDSLNAADQIVLSNIQTIDANAKVACLKHYILGLLDTLKLQTQSQYHASKNKIWQNLLAEVEDIISESKTIHNIIRKQFLINNWFSSKMDAIYIKPRVMHQIFLNSGVNSISECGKKVLEVIDEPSFHKAKNPNTNKFTLSF